jgi:N-acetylmuramoyl-L-alanine amidase
MNKAKNNTVYTATRMRELLSDALLNTTSDDPAVDLIGVMPDLRAIAISEGYVQPVGDFPLPTGDTRAAALIGGVLIDPGHGGAVDSTGSTAYGSPAGRGARSTALEKDINLDVARRVCGHLGNQAVLTRSGDYNLSLRERIERARAAKASAFVSIHSNTGRTDHGGPEVWIYGDGRSQAGPQSQQLAQRIRQELSAIDRSAVPVRQGKLSVLRPDLHGPGVAACLVETGSLEHPRGAARLRDARALDAIGAAVARGVTNYMSKDLRTMGKRGVYGSPAAVLEAPRRVQAPQTTEKIPAQACYHLSAEPHQSNWWDSALPVGALVDTAPPELRELLGFLEVSYATFAPGEGTYFAALGEHLVRHGIVDSASSVDASNFAAAIKEFQGRNNLDRSGVPDERTLWALQHDWAIGRKLQVVKVPADKVAGSDGFDRFRLRSDVSDQYKALLESVHAVGGVITSDGSLRELDAKVTAKSARSSTSMHYSGLAFDMATDTGMVNPARNPFLITRTQVAGLVQIRFGR